MRALLLIPAALALSACADGVLRSPSSFTPNAQMLVQLERFCSDDIATANVEAVQEHVAIINLVVETTGYGKKIDTDDLYKKEAVQRLIAVRSAICLAAAPAPKPAVIEAVAEADVAAVDGALVVSE